MFTSNDIPSGLPLANLRMIDIQKLREDDSMEKKQLFLAARDEGFFYMNFESLPELHELEDVVDGIYKLEHRLFHLSDTEKNEFDVDKQGPLKLNGYKPIGRNVGGVEGKRDGFESWAIPKDGVLGIGNVPFNRPAVLDSHVTPLKIFMKYMQIFTTIVHGALSDELGIGPQERLESFHREDSSSPCILRLLKYHAQPATERGAVQTPHTDLGSLTFLFTSQPGLQVLPKGETNDAWQFVAPRKHCAIVNIGDVLAMMTGGLLQSSLHRVGPLPNLPMDTRYSFAYLQRPEEHTILKTAGANGEAITSGEWLRRKFGMLRKNTYVHDKQWILTGRQEKVIAAI
ncbi:hypothetical protein OPT61_g1399 [Boeremia exigua]|uniref:Uncharacterized protein n=1 Tax=Boeremia exigua TaxID=749465 RepID=A0ACC2IQL4_9PLEO|nr:hypothetical protein OPT61_g1399 [Boeremia exigua]